MPYVKGSGWDAATEQLAEGFATGRRVGLAKQELAQREKDQASIMELRKAQLEIQAAEQQRAEERHAISMRDAADRKKSNEMLDYMRRGEFEHQRLAESREQMEQARLREQSQELDTASELASGARIDDLAIEYPELAPLIKESRETLGSLKSPKARALYGLDRAKALDGMARDLGKKKAKARWNDALRRGYGSDGTAPNESLVKLQEVVTAGLDSDELTGKQAVDLLESHLGELSDDQADVMMRQKNGPLFAQQYVDTEQDPAKALAKQKIIQRYMNGVIEAAQTTKELDNIDHPPAVKPEGADPMSVSPLQLERLIQNAAGQGADEARRTAAEKEVRTRLEKAGAKLPGSKDGGTAKKPTTQAEAQARLNELVAGGLSFEEAKAQVKKEAGGK